MVDDVIGDASSTFFISGRRCFACGSNTCGRLGVGSNDEFIRTPTELPVPVDDLITSDRITVIRSGDTLLACGDNIHRQISDEDDDEITTPTRLQLPGNGPVWLVAIGRSTILVSTHIQSAYLSSRGGWHQVYREEGDGIFPVPDDGFPEMMLDPPINPHPDSTPVPVFDNTDYGDDQAQTANEDHFADDEPVHVAGTGPVIFVRSRLFDLCGLTPPNDTDEFMPIEFLGLAPAEIASMELVPQDESMLHPSDSIFLVTGNRCFAFGANEHGSLGVGDDTSETIYPPREVLPILPTPPSQTFERDGVRLFVSDNSIFICGDNRFGQITGFDDDFPASIPSPVEMDLPGTVNEFYHEKGTIYLGLVGEGWVARGRFIPDHAEYTPQDAVSLELDDGSDYLILDGWTRVGRPPNITKRVSESCSIDPPVTPLNEIFAPLTELNGRALVNRLELNVDNRPDDNFTPHDALVWTNDWLVWYNPEGDVKVLQEMRYDGSWDRYLYSAVDLSTLTEYGNRAYAMRADVSCGMMVFGNNKFYQCGVGGDRGKVTSFMPVEFVDLFGKQVVNIRHQFRRICSRDWTFLLNGGRCFACGLNKYGRLGLNGTWVTFATELPVLVDDLITSDRITVIRSGDTLLACGDNRHRQISDEDVDEITTPTRLQLPGNGPIDRVTVINSDLFIKCGHTWFGRGRVDLNRVFIPDADVVPRDAIRYNPEWRPAVHAFQTKLDNSQQNTITL